MSVTSGGTASKPCSNGGRSLLGGRFGRNGRRLLAVELAVLPPPRPDRTFEIGRIDDDADESVFLHRIVGRPHLERHLMVLAKVDRLDVLALAQVPEMNAMAILVGKQILGNDAVLELWRQRPFARDHVVTRQVPPEIVVLILRTTVDLVTADDVERLAIHEENSRRAVGAVLAAAAERRHVDAFRPAVDRVRARITGLCEHLFRLDDLVNLRLGRVRFGVDRHRSATTAGPG